MYTSVERIHCLLLWVDGSRANAGHCFLGLWGLLYGSFGSRPSKAARRIASLGQGESTDAAAGNVPLIRSFARMLVGQDPLNIEAAFERIRTSGIFAGAQAGQYVTALTGIEIALWDLAGKALGLPVYQLLGGKVRDRVRVYCDSGAREMIPGDEQSKARIKQIQDMGFTAAKIDIDDATTRRAWIA